MLLFRYIFATRVAMPPCYYALHTDTDSMLLLPCSALMSIVLPLSFAAMPFSPATRYATTVATRHKALRFISRCYCRHAAAAMLLMPPFAFATSLRRYAACHDNMTTE